MHELLEPVCMLVKYASDNFAMITKGRFRMCHNELDK